MEASKLLLLRTDDWCGHLDCRCYQCSLTEESFTGTEREYGKKIRHMWKQRKVETGRVVASHEQATWKNTTRMYRTRYPGLLGRVYRDLALHHLRTFALVMAADLMKDEATKKAAEAVQDEHLLQITAMAADPTYVVPRQGWTLSAREASYLFRVTAHIICSYICAACGYYGGDWIEAVSYHFRCPYCGLFYRPWAGRSFNKIIVIVLLYLPCVWPATAPDNWLMAQCELFARQVQIGDNLDAFLARQTCDLARLVDQAGTPAYFKDFRMKAAATWQCTPLRFPPSTYQRHLENFRGDSWVTDPKVLLVIFTDFERLIALLGGMIRGKQVFELSNI